MASPSKAKPFLLNNINEMPVKNKAAPWPNIGDQIVLGSRLGQIGYGKKIRSP